MRSLFSLVYQLLLIMYFSFALGCEQDELKQSFIRVCSNRKAPLGGGMRKHIKEPADLTSELSCEEISSQYHAACRERVSAMNGAVKFSAYINCMQRGAVVEGTKEYLERRNSD